MNKEVIWVNKNFAKTMGYTVNEMKNLKHKQFCTPEFGSSREYDVLWNSLSRGQKFQEKIQRIRKRGNLLWLEATYIPVLNDEGKVNAVLKIATDITSRENNTIEIISHLKDLSLNLGKKYCKQQLSRKYVSFLIVNKTNRINK